MTEYEKELLSLLADEQLTVGEMWERTRKRHVDSTLGRWKVLRTMTSLERRGLVRLRNFAPAHRPPVMVWSLRTT